MNKRGRGILAVVVGLLLVVLSQPAQANPPDAQQSEHDRIVSFWTHARVAQAKPRDFVYDPTSGRFVPSENARGGGKPGGGSGGSTTVTGASWPDADVAVEATTGKVLFQMGASYYVCSASVAGPEDSVSVILTAAHCVYDHASGYASSWVFIPDYDEAPAPLSTSQAAYCPDTAYGCWTASSMHVRSEYITAGDFNSAAIPFDFAFVRVGPGGKSGSSLDATVGSQPLGFGTDVVGDTGYAFGYPAAGKYSGKDLTYCAGTVGTDPYQGGATYALGCNMTGGSSGGPWFEPFDAASGTGTLVSVNSYGYSGIKKMHGPKLGTAASALYATAS